MDVDLMFPSRFIKAADLQGKDATKTIRKVTLEELEREDKTKETKGIIEFADAKKRLVLNKTNALSIKAMFGRETDNWIGKRITMFPTTFNDEPCIRIKGSPDIDKPVTFELKLPKRKAKTMRLIPTAKGAVVEPDIDSNEPPAEREPGEEG